MSCIFCEIIKGNIPGTTVYEDDLVKAILDVNPLTYGHTLVMPKEHCESLLECPDETRNRVYEVAARLGRHYEEVLDCDGINVLANCRPGAGQSVPHFHVHILPRFNNNPSKDSFAFVEGKIDPVDPAALAQILKLD